MKYILESIHDVVNMNAGAKKVFRGEGGYAKLAQAKKDPRATAQPIINRLKNTVKTGAPLHSKSAKWLANQGLSKEKLM